MFHGEHGFDISPISAQPIYHAGQDNLGTTPRIHRVINKTSASCQQGYTSSFSQDEGCLIAPMEAPTPNGHGPQVAMRLRSIARLADRLDAGADVSFVLDLAKAIVSSCGNLDREDSG